MKKFSLIISVLAIVLGLSQCAKKPNMPAFGMMSQTIVFSTGDDGSKGDFQELKEDMYQVLKYKWSNSDVIYVYAQNGGEEFTGEESYFLGKMNLAKVNDADGFEATFEGYFENVPENGWLRFAHYGGDVVVKNDGSASVDLSKQNGQLAGDNSISRKVVSYCDREIDKEGVYAGCSLEVQFAVLKLDLSKFDDKVHLSRIVENGVNVSAKGVITSEEGVFETFSGVSSLSTEYYVAVMEINNEKPIRFSDKTQSGELILTDDIHNNTFYSKGGDGSSIEINPTAYPAGTLPGIFTNGPRETLHFSKGNLYYDGSWHFENAQYKSEYTCWMN